VVSANERFIPSIPAAKSRLGRRNESLVCGNHIVAITMAARMWANDHNERLPLDFVTMSNELNSPRILQCPGDHARRVVRSWADYQANDGSYEVLSTNAGSGDKDTAWLRCRTHGHLGYADGTVFDGKRRRTKRAW